MAISIGQSRRMSDPENLLRESLGLTGETQQATLQAQQSVRALGESRAQSLLDNVRLLELDVGQLRKTGEDVFRVERQEAQYRTDIARAGYLGSGVLLKGSARQVARNIQTQGFREAIAKQQQYEFQARRTQMQADIAKAQAGRERQAAEIEASSIAATARANVKKELSSYLLRNQASYAALESRVAATQQGLQPLGTYLKAEEQVNMAQYQAAR